MLVKVGSADYFNFMFGHFGVHLDIIALVFHRTERKSLLKWNKTLFLRGNQNVDKVDPKITCSLAAHCRTHIGAY